MSGLLYRSLSVDLTINGVDIVVTVEFARDLTLEEMGGRLPTVAFTAKSRGELSAAQVRSLTLRRHAGSAKVPIG
jgi:hypothetical protein